MQKSNDKNRDLLKGRVQFWLKTIWQGFAPNVEVPLTKYLPPKK